MVSKGSRVSQEFEWSKVSEGSEAARVAKGLRATEASGAPGYLLAPARRRGLKLGKGGISQYTGAR